MLLTVNIIIRKSKCNKQQYYKRKYSDNVSISRVHQPRLDINTKQYIKLKKFTRNAMCNTLLTVGKHKFMRSNFTLISNFWLWMFGSFFSYTESLLSNYDKTYQSVINSTGNVLTCGRRRKQCWSNPRHEWISIWRQNS